MTKGSLQWHSRGSDSLLLCLGHFPASYMKINCLKNSRVIRVVNTIAKYWTGITFAHHFRGVTPRKKY